MSLAATARALDVSVQSLTQICGKAARTNEDHYRPIPPGDVLSGIALLGCTNTNYLLCWSDNPHPIVEECVRGFTSVAEMLTEKLMEHAAANAAMRGHGIDLKAILEWHRASNGLVGVGHPIEEKVDLVEVPDASARIVKPYKTGRDSLATHLTGANDAQDFWVNHVQKWSPEKNMEITGHYRMIEDIKYGDALHLFPMTIQLANHVEPQHYHRIILPAHLPTTDAPKISICVAF